MPKTSVKAPTSGSAKVAPKPATPKPAATKPAPGKPVAKGVPEKTTPVRKGITIIDKAAAAKKAELAKAATSPAKPDAKKPTMPVKPGSLKPGAPVKPGAKDAKGKLISSEPQPRYKNPFVDTSFADGKAAAAKLFAAAGLGNIKTIKNNGFLEESNIKRLTKSPLSKKQLKEFEDMLLEKRREIVTDVKSMESEALTGGSGSLSNLPQHMADQGTDTFDQSMALNIAASKRVILRDIDLALDRIKDNTYGICEALGKPIEEERLQSEPWTKFSIDGARYNERTQFLR